jgi:hypothetical protein
VFSSILSFSGTGLMSGLNTEMCYTVLFDYRISEYTKCEEGNCGTVTIRIKACFVGGTTSIPSAAPRYLNEELRRTRVKKITL